MNDQIGIDVKFGEESYKAYKLDKGYKSHYLRAMSTIRIAQHWQNGELHNIDTDISCDELEASGKKVYEPGFVEINSEKYLLLKLA